MFCRQSSWVFSRVFDRGCAGLRSSGSDRLWDKQFTNTVSLWHTVGTTYQAVHPHSANTPASGGMTDSFVRWTVFSFFPWILRGGPAFSLSSCSAVPMTSFRTAGGAVLRVASGKLALVVFSTLDGA